MDINGFGKILILLGIVFTAVGLLLMASPNMPWIGKLPGDICITKGDFTFYFPLATSVLISVILSLILLFIGRIK